MGIFSRIADVFKSNVNDALDKVEDPEKMLKQMVAPGLFSMRQLRIKRPWNFIRSRDTISDRNTLSALKIGNY